MAHKLLMGAVRRYFVAAGGSVEQEPQVGIGFFLLIPICGVVKVADCLDQRGDYIERCRAVRTGGKFKRV